MILFLGNTDHKMNNKEYDMVVKNNDGKIILSFVPMWLPICTCLILKINNSVTIIITIDEASDHSKHYFVYHHESGNLD